MRAHLFARGLICLAGVVACLPPSSLLPERGTVAAKAMAVDIRGVILDDNGRRISGAHVHLLLGLSVPDMPPEPADIERVVAPAPAGEPLDGSLQSTPLDGSLQSTPLDGGLQTTPLARPLRYPLGPLRVPKVVSSVLTDDQGRFRLEAPAPGHFSIQVLDPATGRVSAREVFLQASTSGIDIGSIHLGRPRTLKGRLSGPPGWDPSRALVFLPGGEVWVRPFKDGTFVLEGVPPGSPAVAAVAAGLLPAVLPLPTAAGEDVLEVADLRLLEPQPVLERVEPEVVAPGATVSVLGQAFGAWQGEPWQLMLDDVVLSDAVRMDDRRIDFIWPDELPGERLSLKVGNRRSEVLSVTAAASWSVLQATASLWPGEMWPPAIRVTDARGRQLSGAGSWTWWPHQDWARRAPEGLVAARPGLHHGRWRLGRWESTASVRVSTHVGRVILQPPGLVSGNLEGTADIRLFQPAWMLPAPEGSGWWFCDRRGVAAGSLQELSEIRWISREGIVRVVRSEPEGAGVRWTQAAACGRGVLVLEEQAKRFEVWQPEATRMLGVEVPPRTWTSLPELPESLRDGTLPGPMAWHPRWGLFATLQSSSVFRLLQLDEKGNWTVRVEALGPTYPEPTMPILAPNQAQLRAQSLMVTEEGDVLLGSTSRLWCWPRLEGVRWGRLLLPGRFTALLGDGTIDGGPVGHDPSAISVRVISGLALVGKDLWVADGNHHRLLALSPEGKVWQLGGGGWVRGGHQEHRLLDWRWLRPGPLANGPEGTVGLVERLGGRLLEISPLPTPR
ncbi:MAG: hypothetical protein VKO21_05375 [Candidatus Sericytochromatia bacterium]|nr:hypothetical protein [Candidatus Sericytochromatia bacterium]